MRRGRRRAIEDSADIAEDSPDTPTEPARVEDLVASAVDMLSQGLGKDAITRLDDESTISRVDHWIATRSMVVDAVLRGGRPWGSSLLPCGRITEIAGVPGTGKSTLCAHLAAETQAQGGLVVVTDTEERIDHVYWTRLGVDISKVITLKSKTIREVFDKQYTTLRLLQEDKRFAGITILLIYDSLGGTGLTKVVENKKESPMEQAEKFAMRSAKEVGAGMRIINEIVGSTRCAYVYTNHLYTKIGTSFGDPWESYGGQKPQYFASVRLRLEPRGEVRIGQGDKERVLGHRVMVCAKKNSVSGHLYELPAVVMPDKGFVDGYTIHEIGHDKSVGVVQASGAWKTWVAPSGEEVKWSGWDQFEEKVATHLEYPELVKQVSMALPQRW